MSELSDLRAAEKATAANIEGLAVRAEQYRHRAANAEQEMDKERQRLSSIRRKIVDLTPLCLFEDEAAEKCTTKAAWKIEFPEIDTVDALNDTVTYRLVGGLSATKTTLACHDHLYMMADDYSGSPALVSAIREDS